MAQLPRGKRRPNVLRLNEIPDMDYPTLQSRRHFNRRLASLVMAPLALGTAGGVSAQVFPSRPITLVTPAPPGGAVDVMARVLGEQLAKTLGQTVIVDNKPGASGMLAVQAVVRAPADGYTLLFTHTTPISYTPHMFSKMAYDVPRDLRFITHVCDADLVLAVNKDVPASNMKEFLAWAAARRGKLNYGSYGTGSGGHLMTAYLSESRQLDMTHVPYKGETPMMQDLVGGQIVLAFGTAGTLVPLINAGRIRAIAVTGPKRFADLPDVQTLAEAGAPDPEFRVIGGILLMAPAATPEPVLARLEVEARAAVQSTPVKARMQIYGLRGVGGSAVQARQAYEDSTPLIAKLVKVSGVKME